MRGGVITTFALFFGQDDGTFFFRISMPPNRSTVYIETDDRTLIFNHRQWNPL